MEFELPRYSAAVPVPDYSYEPGSGERTLQQAPRSSRQAASSTLIKHSGKTTVVLHNQVEHAKSPSYGRGAAIAGSVLLESSDSISQVALQIHGKIETMSTEGGSTTTVVLDNKRLLWSDISQSGHCPSQLEFSVRLPHTFKDNGAECPLPPTYSVEFYGVPGLFVRTTYYMQFEVTRRPTQRFGFLTKTKRIPIPFEYSPRTRPHRPISTSTSFFSDVKIAPEAWHQTIAPLKTPQNADLGTVYSHVLIPSSRIYGIRDTIPLHVQLSAPEQTLRAYLQPKSKESSKRKRDKTPNHQPPSFFPILTQKKPSPSPLPNFSESPAGVVNTSFTSPSPPFSPNSLNSFSKQPSARNPPSLSCPDDANPHTPRVFLVRQITITSRSGKTSFRNQFLGEAKLVNVPPLLSTEDYSLSGNAELPEEDHLDWEGELQINESHTVGSWQAANVHIKDFIALSVLPQNERTSVVHGIQLTVPVKLVTDPWTEEPASLGHTPLNPETR